LCSGCGIGDALDLDELNGVVTKEMSMECKVHSCMCSADGRGLIQKDIEEGLNTIVIGACSPRVMTKEFDFGEDKIVVRAKSSRTSHMVGSQTGRRAGTSQGSCSLSTGNCC